MTWLRDPFMTAITALYAMSAIRQVCAGDWPHAWYAIAAVVLNLSVMTMGAR